MASGLQVIPQRVEIVVAKRIRHQHVHIQQVVRLANKCAIALYSATLDFCRKSRRHALHF
jgi:hypothetical protein